MFRALSTSRSRRGYEQLEKEPSPAGEEEPKLKRLASLPARVFRNSSKKLAPATTVHTDPPLKQTKRASKTHPLFGLFNGRRKVKTTAKPEFARYLEYVKEGGFWDLDSNKPVIYFK